MFSEANYNEVKFADHYLEKGWMSERRASLKMGVAIKNRMFYSNFNHGFKGGSEPFRGELTRIKHF